MGANPEFNPEAQWTLINHRATLAHCGLGGLVDVAAPSRGLAHLQFQHAEIGGHLLGIDAGADAPPDDAYVRGADLAVVYRETPARPYSVQIYWTVRRAAGTDGVILDATISIQTRQWEAYPRVSVSSDLPGAATIVLDPSVLVLRPAGATWSYVETAPAEDFAFDAPGDRNGTAWQFGEQFMERGVIRRLRVRGALVPRLADKEIALRLNAALRAESPPLTA